ncbi:radical SAM protein [Clostridium sp. JS66]|uniref:radical SAM protein n=1 Tax=Clostridium sp. JS66 TaxID=3064705 RepID=UPI00298DE969|nr:radical SAM protein [Clostridium sp. JS66]WPC41031.1 radical SAM protein [Clostridium sp. JS66]
MTLKRINPFKHIYKECNGLTNYEKYNNIPYMPRYIDIELTNNCNYKCLMCPVGTSSMIREKGNMSDETYSKILDEIKYDKIPLRFIRWGEPLLHPKFFQYLKMAKQLGIMCHLNTNGSIVSEDIAEKIIDSKLDSIKFSFQGVDRKSYKEMRNKDYFNQLLQNIKKLYKIRENRKYPFIHISTTITYESAKQVENFKNEVGEYCDLVTVGRTMLERIDVEKTHISDQEKSMLLELKQQESLKKVHLKCCPEVFDKLSINWDGTISGCSGDYDKNMLVGDIKENSLIDIWNSKLMNYYRRVLSEGKYDSLTLCKNCYDYMSMQTPGVQDNI